MKKPILLFVEMKTCDSPQYFGRGQVLNSLKLILGYDDESWSS